MKRVFDIVVAGATLIALSPLVAAVAIAVKLESPGPVVFRQQRVGRDGMAFWMLKFRTMLSGPPDADDGSAPVPQVSDFSSYVFDPRYGGKQYTRIGGFMRSTSIDELPNLINVLRGEMSIVGPRPDVPELVAQYPAKYQRRHSVRPGITGLAQVNGRSSLTYEEMMLYDLKYVDHHSLLRDLVILAKTPPAVLSQRGAR